MSRKYKIIEKMTYENHTSIRRFHIFEKRLFGWKEVWSQRYLLDEPEMMGHRRYLSYKEAEDVILKEYSEGCSVDIDSNVYTINTY